MRTFAEGKAFAQRQHENPTQNWSVLCQAFSRQCVGADGWASSARLAFNSIPASHRHNGTPPPGSLAYFGSSSHGFGHVIFVVEGGMCWSNDILRRGKIDKVRWDVFPSRWGLPYRGWIDWTPDGPIDIPSHRAAPSPQRLTPHQLHVLHAVNKNLPGVSAHMRHQAHVYVTEGRWIP